MTAWHVGDGWFRLREGDAYFGQPNGKLALEAMKPYFGDADYYFELFFITV